MLEFINCVKLDGQVIYIKNMNNANSSEHIKIDIKEITNKDIEMDEPYEMQWEKKRY